MRYVSFQTDLFFIDIPDEQLDHWFLGADCSGWFYARLLPVDQIAQDLDPTMEDWGWIMAVKARGVVVDICVWEYLGMERNWVLGIASKRKWLRNTDPVELANAEELVVSAIDDILGSDPRFTKIRWSTENPLEDSSEVGQQ